MIVRAVGRNRFAWRPYGPNPPPDKAYEPRKEADAFEKQFSRIAL
jgi:hypothetical protein